MLVGAGAGPAGLLAVPNVMLPPGAAGLRLELEMFPKLKAGLLLAVVVATLEPNGVELVLPVEPKGPGAAAGAGVVPAALNAKLVFVPGVVLVLPKPNPAELLVVMVEAPAPLPKAGAVLVEVEAPNLNVLEAGCPA